MQNRILANNYNKYYKLLKSNFHLIHNDSNKHVCLIGFQGSTMRKIRKHVDIYQKRDFNISIFTPNYFQNYNQNYVYNAAYKLNDIIKKENKKTIFHVISGGAYPLSVLINQMILDDNLNLVDKIIYDSAPVSCNFCSGVRALKLSNNYKIPDFMLNKILNTYLLYARLPMNTWCQSFYNTLNSPLLNDIEKLFLISKNDKIIPYEETLEFLQHQSNYQMVEFESQHGKNIISNNDLYELSIEKFINNKKI